MKYFALIASASAIQLSDPPRTWYLGQTLDDNRMFNSEDEGDFVQLKSEQAPFFPDVGVRDESADKWTTRFYPGTRAFYKQPKEEYDDYHRRAPVASNHRMQ